MCTVSIKVVHLTSVHRPFDIRIFHKECKTLAEAGYEVVLVVPHDRDEVVDGVRIRAVPKPGGRRERMTRAVWRVYRTALHGDAQVYHFHDPELILVGLLLKLRGKQVVWDIHEDLPRQVLTKHWIPGGLRRIVSKAAEAVESFCELGFDAIAAATPVIAHRFTQKKTFNIQNFPVLHESADFKAEPYTERDPIVVYVGGIGAIRGAREMVAAMDLLPRASHARLALAGVFSPPGLEAELQRIPGWKRVEFVGWRSQNEVKELLAESRVGLVLFHPAPNHTEAQPNKLFEYMVAGIPVIVSDFPLWRDIVEKVGCGLLVDPLKPRAIAESIQWILEHPQQAEAMGKRGQAAVVAQYNWDTEAQKLLELYKRLAK